MIIAIVIWAFYISQKNKAM